MSWLIPVLARLCLVVMFPFSAADKVVHWKEAMVQARSAPLPGAAWMLVAAIIVEFCTPFMIVLGIEARLAAFVLAGFCLVTALLYHPFWNYPDFWAKDGIGRSNFWDFLKNFGLVGGLLLVICAGPPIGLGAILSHPLSSPPYTTHAGYQP
jgi:putative oxidoreductase